MRLKSKNIINIFLILVGVALNCTLLKAKKIIIVDIDFDNRQEVGLQLKIIAGFSPKVIGIDVLYTNDSLSTDSILVGAIKSFKNIVMAAKLHNLDVPYPFWDSLELAHEKFNSNFIGFSNIYTESDRIIPEIPIQESYKGKMLSSFSYEIARRSAPQLKRIKSKSLIIKRIPKTAHKIIRGKDILTGKHESKDFENKIVLLGYIGDKFYLKRFGKKTISGIEIQAHFIENLIHNYAIK